uniref:hypothetical protein n=1 Tax=Flavobacterium sp. TaxID=239 RepID=UPI004047FC88
MSTGNDNKLTKPIIAPNCKPKSKAMNEKLKNNTGKSTNSTYFEKVYDLDLMIESQENSSLIVQNLDSFLSLAK